MTLDACRFCNGETQFFCTSEILTFSATYASCITCKSVQVDSPHWIGDVHKKAISSFDVGLVSRGVSASKLISVFFFLQGELTISGVDWGGGTGLLTRLLRDLGLNFKSHDKYATNIMAEGFTADGDLANEDYDAVSAIECMEHLENPYSELVSSVNGKRYFIFTTEILPTPLPDPRRKEWWYYMPDSGQHITFASAKGLDTLAKRLNFQYNTTFGSIHVFSNKKVKWHTRYVLNSRLLRPIALIIVPVYLQHSKSLLGKDSSLIH
jgi:hypothetical protein